MNESNDINLPSDFDDLSKHAPLLDKLRANGDGFVVPENYFNELEERIFVIYRFQSTFNNQHSTFNNPFPVPEGYFEQLISEIESIIELNDLKKENNFDVPDSYFKELDASLNTKLALDNLKQDEGFNIPENYFEKLSSKIITRLAVDELKTGSESDLPEGYFDTLVDRITSRIAEDENSETETERGRIIVFTEVFKRYARPISIAASVTLLIGLSIWFFNQSGNKKTPQDEIAKKEIPVIAPVIPPALQDSVITPIEKNIVEQPVQKQKRDRVNQKAVAVVKEVKKEVNKDDALEQLYMIDESTVADFVSNNNSDYENANKEQNINEDMLNYLLDENADLSEINKQP
ncbi:hypothetical protein BH09BAC5_BH09BAC5_29970 [soil metagenome]